MATKRKPESYLAKLYRGAARTGRPPKYRTVKDLRDKIDKYFASIVPQEIHTQKENEYDEFKQLVSTSNKEVANELYSTAEIAPTITGLALFLGFADKQSLHDYEKVSPEFSYTIRAARSIVERYHELRVATLDRPQGSIFVLQNMGWTTKVEVKDTSETPRQVFKIGGLEVEF